MKKALFKTFCMILCAVLALGAAVPTGFVAYAADSGDLSGTIHWSYTNGTLSITGTGDIPMGALAAPTSEHAENIVNVTVGDGITSLCMAAFKLCRNLKTVSLPNTLVSIPRSCFMGCAQLTEIAIPAGVQSIGEMAFMECTALQKVTFGGNLHSIGGNAFRGCTALKSVKFPAKLSYIGGEAFMATGLESVTLPGSVRLIGSWAFAQCPALKNAILSSGLTTLPDCVFQNSALEYAVLPKSVKTVHEASFYNCTLKNIFYEGTRAEFEQIDIVGSANAFAATGKLFEAANVVTAQVATDLMLKRGDIDGAEGVTASDARAALRAAVELEPIAAATDTFYLADTDGDAAVTAADARMILRAAVDLEDLKNTAPHTPGAVPDAALSALEAFTGTLNDLLKQYDAELLYCGAISGVEALAVFHGSKDAVVLMFNGSGVFFKHRFTPTAAASQLEAAAKEAAGSDAIAALAPDTVFNVFQNLGGPVTSASLTCATDGSVYLITYSGGKAASIARF